MNRQFLTLTTLEIVYLVGLLGGTRFPIIDLDKIPETDLGLRKAMDQAQLHLERKQYIEVDFDGSVSIDFAVHRFITEGLSCATCYTQFVLNREAATQIAYLICEEDLYMMIEEEKDYRVLKLYGQHELQSQIVDNWFLNQEIDQYLDNSLILEQQEFQEFFEKHMMDEAIYSALARVEQRNETAEVTAELKFLQHGEQLWQLNEVEDNVQRHQHLYGVTYVDALETLSQWVRTGG